MSGFPVPTPLLFAAAAGSQRLLARGRRPTRSSLAASVLLTAPTLLIGADSLRRLHRDGTTFDPLHPSRATALVRDGAFAITRNPLYVAQASLLAAHTLLRRSPAAMGPVAAYLLVLDRTQVQAEEAALAENFGEDWADYRRQVPRWF